MHYTSKHNFMFEVQGEENFKETFGFVWHDHATYVTDSIATFLNKMKRQTVS